jgi:peptidoglycan hydrolase-like protein with peptidoglycan-binding domain
MAQPKRKSPDKRSTKRPPPSRAVRLLYATGSSLARHPRLLIGLAGFTVVFSFVAANALWYQPKHHPAPLLATRSFEGDNINPVNTAQLPSADDVETDPGVTTFRIERQSDEQAAESAQPAAKEASPLVKSVQQGLAARGLYDGPADGLIGPKTTSAILFFQETEGLDTTGEPSAELVKRLKSVRKDVAVIPDERPSMDQTASTKKTLVKNEDDIADLIRQANVPVPTPSATDSEAPAEMVMKIQKALSGLAYADIKVDGIPGATTRAAIRNFEKSYRLPITGEPSERVLKKLKSIGAI